MRAAQDQMTGAQAQAQAQAQMNAAQAQYNAAQAQANGAQLNLNGAQGANRANLNLYGPLPTKKQQQQQQQQQQLQVQQVQVQLQQQQQLMCRPPQRDAPLCSFGIFSDVQFNCAANNIKCRGWRSRKRFNQTTIEQLHAAVEDWACRPVNFVVNLGDLTEVHQEPGYDRDGALQEVLCALDRLQVPKYHAIGHHDLKQFCRTELIGTRLHSGLVSNDAETPAADNFYYHFSPAPGVRIVVLDLYEIALIGYADQPNHPNLAEAKRLVAAANPNPNPRHCENMPWQHMKYTSINGGCSAAQLRWFEGVLNCSQNNGETVIVCGHNPLCATNPQRYSFVTWSNAEILRIMYNFTCAQAYFGGHDGDGGYVQDDCGLHHIILPGIVETPPDSRAHATVHVLRDRLEVVGCGRMPSMTLYYCRRPLREVPVGVAPGAVPNADPEDEEDFIDKILDKIQSLSICGSIKKKKLAKNTMSKGGGLPQAHIKNFMTPDMIDQKPQPPPPVQSVAPPPAPGPTLLPKHWPGCQCDQCRECTCGPCKMFCNCKPKRPLMPQAPPPSIPSPCGPHPAMLTPREPPPGANVGPQRPVVENAYAVGNGGQTAIIRPNAACGNKIYSELSEQYPTLAPRLTREPLAVEAPPPPFNPCQLPQQAPCGILKKQGDNLESFEQNSCPGLYEVPFPGKVMEPCGELPPRACPPQMALQGADNIAPPPTFAQGTARPPAKFHLENTWQMQGQTQFPGQGQAQFPGQGQGRFPWQGQAQLSGCGQDQFQGQVQGMKPESCAEIVPQQVEQCGVNCGCGNRQNVYQQMQAKIRPSTGAHGVIQNRQHIHGTGNKPVVFPTTNVDYNDPDPGCEVPNNFGEVKGPVYI